MTTAGAQVTEPLSLCFEWHRNQQINDPSLQLTKEQVVARHLGVDDVSSLQSHVEKVVRMHEHDHDRMSKIKAHFHSLYPGRLRGRNMDFFLEALKVEDVVSKLNEPNRFTRFKSGLSASSNKKQARPCVNIAVFNFKGGVGKTTTTINVAAAMAKTGFRVGIVDADVQGNASGFFYKASDEGSKACEKSNEPSEVQGENISGPLHANLTQSEKCTARVLVDQESGVIEHFLHDKLMVALVGKHGFESSIDVDNISNPENDFYLMEHAGIDAPLYILRGDAKLSKVEHEILPYLRKGESDMVTKDGVMVGSFRVLLQRLAIKNDLDVIFCDVGPSSSLFNQWLVMSCDYILPPSFADKYSALSIKDFVTEVLPSFQITQAGWVKLADKKSEYLNGNDGYIFNTRTQVLPFMICNYYAKKNAKKYVIAKANSEWIRSIASFLRGLKEDDEEKLAEYVPISLGNDKVHYCTPLKELKGELPISQSKRIPLPCLAASHVSKLGGADERMEYIKQQYMHIVEFLILGCKLDKIRDHRNPHPETCNILDSPRKRKRKRSDQIIGKTEKDLREDESLSKDERAFLSILVEKAHNVISSLNLETHGKYIGGNTVKEEDLSADLHYGLTEKLQKSSFPVASAKHQHRKADDDDIIIADILILNVFQGQAGPCRHVVVETKLEVGSSFDSRIRKRHHQQVSRYMEVIKGTSHGFLVNFEKNSTCVEIYMAKETHPGSSQIASESWTKVYKGYAPVQ